MHMSFHNGADLTNAGQLSSRLSGDFFGTCVYNVAIGNIPLHVFGDGVNFLGLPNKNGSSWNIVKG